MPDTERTRPLQIPERPYTGQVIFHGTAIGKISMVRDRSVFIEWSDGSFSVEYPITEFSYPWKS